MDIRPVTPGHLLVIAKRHAPYLADLDEATGARMFMVAMRLAKALRASGLRCEGINLFLADREAAFQEVFHTHLHVFPRFVGDTFRIDADWSFMPSRAELDEIAAQVRVAMPNS
jgi:histidine triad (HIT) family protein